MDLEMCARGGIYLEYHSVCPLVRVGISYPLSRKRVCPPQEPKEGDTLACERRGGRVPTRTAGEKANTLFTLWGRLYKLQSSTSSASILYINMPPLKMAARAVNILA
jgi:hypothetical protein